MTIKKLKIIASDFELSDAMVVDEDGNVLGVVDEISIKPKKTITICKVNTRGTTLSQKYVQNLKEALEAEIDGAFVICDSSIEFKQIKLSSSKNIKTIFEEEDGKILNEEDVEVREILE